MPHFEASEPDSIFGESQQSDDVFGTEEVPKIEMPPLDLPPADLPPVDLPPSAPLEPAVSMPTVTLEPVPAPEAFTPQPEPTPALFEDSAVAEMTPISPRRVVDRSLFLPIVLIFLVPYAIFTTAFIAYLLYMARNQVHPLKMLPDKDTKGAPRQVKHDIPLDADMKTVLGQAIRVGAIEVTPLQVTLTPFGDLVFVFKAKNISTHLAFHPMSDQFLKYSDSSMDSGRPYTFLERLSKTQPSRAYGGTLELHPAVAGRGQDFNGELEPGAEAIVHLTSDAKLRDDVIPDMVKATERLLWRVQVRRGLVEVDDKMVSATAVVGVEFSSKDIIKEVDDGES
jgi:hypothetical protein